MSVLLYLYSNLGLLFITHPVYRTLLGIAITASLLGVGADSSYQKFGLKIIFSHGEIGVAQKETGEKVTDMWLLDYQ